MSSLLLCLLVIPALGVYILAVAWARALGEEHLVPMCSAVPLGPRPPHPCGFCSLCFCGPVISWLLPDKSTSVSELVLNSFIVSPWYKCIYGNTVDARWYCVGVYMRLCACIWVCIYVQVCVICGSGRKLWTLPLGLTSDPVHVAEGHARR